MPDLRFRAPLIVPPGGAVPLLLGWDYVGDFPVATPEVGTGLHVTATLPWRRAGAHEGATRAAAWRRAAPTGAGRVLPWRRADPQPAAERRLPWRQAAATDASVLASARDTGSVATWVDGSSQDADHVAAVRVLPWGLGTAVGNAVMAPWRRAAAAGQPVLAPWSAPNRARVDQVDRFGRGVRADTDRRLPWRDGAGLYSEGGPWTIPVPPGGPDPHICYTPPAGDVVDLLFADRLQGFTALLFQCRRALALISIPIREVYMVTNTVTLARLSDGEPIPTLGMSLSLDVDSWAWGFSASLPAAALSLIEPPAPGEPCLLEATVNGTPVRVAVESIGSERVFGQASVRISGRGISAALADPYYPAGTFTNASTQTSQQLLDAAMPFGWDVDWGLTAWLVPAGAWSHQGTPASAALAIAAAGGGYVQPHNTLQRLRVLPRYPTVPWDWAAATPDIEIPSAVATRESIEWIEKARYNRVYVQGQNVGVRGRVTRTGTAGDILAPMVTDPLITHADAARQRGIAVLGDTGRQAHVTLRLPVLPETGLILPGKMTRYVDGSVTRIGITRSVSIETTPQTAWQSIRIETPEAA